MAPPTTWASPTSGGTATTGTLYGISEENGYWFAVGDTGSAYTVRYATDPSASWSTASLSTAIPTDTKYYASPVRYGDGVYAFAYSLNDVSSPNWKLQIAHTTDPTSTWSLTTVTPPASTNAGPWGMKYLNGQWVMYGMYRYTDYMTVNSAFIATASSVTGTWTFYSGTDVGDQGGILGICTGVDWDGSNYAISLTFNDEHPELKYSSAINGPWTSATSTFFENCATAEDITWHPSAGYWTATYFNPSGDGVIAYAADPTGTWTELVKTKTLVNNASSSARYVSEITHDGTYWFVVGYTPTFGHRGAYLESTGSPDGTYTVTSTGVSPVNTHASGRYLLVGANTNQQLRYAYIPVLSTGPTFLRQHQSPVMTPSRVRGVDLRQSQTPRITR